MNVGRLFIDGILHETEFLLLAMARLEIHHIVDPPAKAIYNLVRLAYQTEGLLLTRSQLPDYMERKLNNPESVKLLNAYLFSQEVRVPSESEFNYSMAMLRQEAKRRKVILNCSSAIQAMSRGQIDGVETVLLDGLELFGSEQNEEAQLAREVQMVEDMYDAPDVPGIPCGIREIDALTGGGRPGQFWIWGGYTNQGKTQIMKECAYHVAIECGKNVLWQTMEMEIDEMMSMFVVRHSHKFKQGGLDAKAVELKNLSPEDEQIFRHTVSDLRTNDAYGRVDFWKPDRNSTLGHLEAKLDAVHKRDNIEMCVVDYMEILSATIRRKEYRLEIKEKAQRMKRVAADMGIWLMTAHQMSRQGFDDASRRGYYEMRDLGESSGVEANASFVGWILTTPALRDTGRTKIGVMKCRNSRVMWEGIEVAEDFAHGRVAT